MHVRTLLQAGLAIAGAVILGLIGWGYGTLFIRPSNFPPPFNTELMARLVPSVILGVSGGVIAPFVFGGLFNAFVEKLNRFSATQFVVSLLGLCGGLFVALLLAYPISRLPAPFGQVLPFVTAILLAAMGVGVLNQRHIEIFNLLGIRFNNEALATPNRERILLDTSVIIDGRIADVIAAGFIRADLWVPRFVLNELQFIADSPDAIRRGRGRRGLEILRRMQSNATVPIKITDDDVADVMQVDEKLIVLAKQTACLVLTNDYNLNKVASLQGVTVLNINELANAVKTVLLPGENLSVRIIQAGRENGQGVGYLEDGTMVVVEDGENFINKTLPVTVTKILQTAAGRMIFAKP
jgi:uncharacterized protein YacL